MTMRKWIASAARLGVFAALFALGGVAFAQQFPGALKIISLSGGFTIDVNTTGQRVAKLPLNGGTFTCNSSTPVVVAQANVDAGSVILYGNITPSTPGIAPYTSSVTVGTGFSVTCAASDVSVYNYIVLG